mgnify:CR=1 FL=1
MNKLLHGRLWWLPRPGPRFMGALVTSIHYDIREMGWWLTYEGGPSTPQFVTLEDVCNKRVCLEFDPREGRVIDLREAFF